ncbi:ferric reductase transmembrane component 4 [[Candida] railenensis]|uniref:ferric-chelate reductase (NADPH) n=1 Tax=[Candida] railenensis TaxID=45579 RepID=A0A9P0W090_9ASCO|nr:ferric reductase transmembrane component 4 [[Candida] railenensis]
MLLGVDTFWIVFLKLDLLLKYLFSFLVLSNVVVSEKGAPYPSYSETILSFYSCNLAIRASASFCDESDYGCACYNPAALASVAGCLNYGNEPNGKETEFFNFCAKNYATTITEERYWAAYENYTKYAVHTSDIKGFNKSVPISVPIILNSTLISDYRHAYINFLGNYNHSLYYGSGVLGYWALVFVLATIFHWAKFLCPGLMKKCTGPITNFWRKNVTLPALGKKDKTNDVTILKFINILLPSRAETLVLIGFCVVTVFASSHDIHWSEGDPIFPKKQSALLRFIADRTGIVATIMMPMLILFAGRNNFLQWITGINFASFIAYHKWMARVVFVLVMIHSVCFSVIILEKKERKREAYLVWGTIATLAGLIIWVQSILYLRRKWYEVFLIVHIVMAALFIGGSWIHVDELGYAWFFYATVIVWFFDRAVRVARLIHFGFPKATVSLLANETLKVVVRRPKFWPAIPGGHAFLHFMRPSCFWQSHPFTFTLSPDSDENIVMYCKVKGGVTHGLYQYLATHPGKTTQIRVSLEGPYGEPTPARVYDSAVFIAGGSGIPGIYSEVLDLATRAVQDSNKLLKLHWVVKDYDSLFWFYDEILALKDTNIQCTIHVTRPTMCAEPEQEEVFSNTIPEQSSSDGSLHYDKKNDSVNFTAVDEVSAGIVGKIKYGLRHVTFLEGRPSIEKIVKAEVEESSGSIAFVTCGHPYMVDELRYCCAHALYDSKGKRIDFFEQLQVWA